MLRKRLYAWILLMLLYLITPFAVKDIISTKIISVPAKVTKVEILDSHRPDRINVGITYSYQVDGKKYISMIEEILDIGALEVGETKMIFVNTDNPAKIFDTHKAELAFIFYIMGTMIILCMIPRNKHKTAPVIDDKEGDEFC